MKAVLLACALLCTFAPVAKANDITYTFNQSIVSTDASGSFTVTGTLTTDGTIGALAKADIVGFDLNVAGQVLVYNGVISYQNFSFSVDPSTGGTMFYTGGLSATATSLSFDFGGNPVGELLFQTPQNSTVGEGELQFYASSESASDYGVGEVTDGPLAAGVIATAATPEPSSLILLGTGVLGVAGAARRRFRQT